MKHPNSFIYLLISLFFGGSFTPALAQTDTLGKAVLWCAVQDGRYAQSPGFKVRVGGNPLWTLDIFFSLQQALPGCKAQRPDILANFSLPPAVCDDVTSYTPAISLQALKDIETPLDFALDCSEKHYQKSPDTIHEHMGQELPKLYPYLVETYLKQHQPQTIAEEPTNRFVLQQFKVGKFGWAPSLLLGYRYKDSAFLVNTTPYNKSLKQRSITTLQFDQFFAQASQWTIEKKATLDSPITAIQTQSHQAEFKRLLWSRLSHVMGMLTTVAGSTRVDLPIYGWEILGKPDELSGPRLSRLRMALATLNGEDAARLESVEQDAWKTRRGEAEIEQLRQAIQDNQFETFKQGLANPKAFDPQSDQSMDMFFLATRLKRPQFATALLDSGLPLLENKNIASGFMKAFLQQLNSKSTKNFDPDELIESIRPAVAASRYGQAAQFWQELSSQARHEADTLRNQKLIDETIDGLQTERIVDPRLKFAASISNKVLLAAIGGNHPPLDTRDQNGNTVLFYALATERTCASALEMISNGADVVTPSSDYGVTPLMHAAANCMNDAVKRILQRKVAVNAVSKDNSTALLYAALAGRLQNVKWLLAAGADRSITDSKGLSPLTGAKQQRFNEVVKVLE